MGAKEFSLILPTKDRPKLAARLLQTIAQTSSDMDRIEVILYTHEDDTDSREIEYPGVPLVKISGNIKLMGAITNECYKKTSGKFIMLLNDDMIFRTKNWDLMVEEEFARFPDGVALIYGNDLYYGKGMASFPILSRVACKMMGRICPSEFKRHYIDVNLFDIFSKLSVLGHNRLIYMQDLVFEHMFYELSIIAYDNIPRFSDTESDQKVFSSLETLRQDTAIKMARFIKNHQG